MALARTQLEQTAAGLSLNCRRMALPSSPKSGTSSMYADMARWEIQQRQRGGQIRQLGANTSYSNSPLSIYQYGPFVRDRSAPWIPVLSRISSGITAFKFFSSSRSIPVTISSLSSFSNCYVRGEKHPTAPQADPSETLANTTSALISLSLPLLPFHSTPADLWGADW